MGRTREPDDTIQVQTKLYSIFHGEDLEDDTKEGDCNAWTAVIRTSEDLAPSSVWPATSHEIGHAVWAEVNLRNRLSDALGVSLEVIDRIEEHIMDCFIPGYCTALEGKGWLTPPVPKARAKRGRTRTSIRPKAKGGPRKVVKR